MRSRFQKAVFLSFLAHILVVLFVRFGLPKINDFLTSKTALNTSIELVDIDAQKLREIRKQIVESELIEKASKVPDKAFLGAQDQVVLEQKRAHKVGKFETAKLAQSQSENRDNKNQMSPLGLTRSYKPLGGKRAEDLISAEASSNDYLKDIKPGAQTLLNTKEFQYYSFYQRVRRQLEQFWEPGLRDRLHQMYIRGRRLAEDHEHSTKLTVELNSEGQITRIQVQDTSGLLDLDQSAIDAFNKAGPFPNPPKGLLSIDGTVRIDWEFVLRT